ncbi:T-cell surface glycoprotein CD3 epsilon chain-like [Nothobranchius furzeri]|uniref:T-cell surface glycoprotein CD3 epsilon chain-like n=1 Tax=Nothobranchius furzeri TaxID=105023 RepID=UPI003904AB16
MGVRAVFVVLLLLEATVEAHSGKGDVAFWRDKVTLTCPGIATWFEGENKVNSSTNSNLTLEFEYKRLSQYSCEYEEHGLVRKCHFFVKGKACPNCFEVDGFLFMLVIMVDVIGTAVLMMTIYKCTKKRRPAGPPPPPRFRCDEILYLVLALLQSLNPNTVSLETYSTVVHRTG